MAHAGFVDSDSEIMSNVDVASEDESLTEAEGPSHGVLQQPPYEQGRFSQGSIAAQAAKAIDAAEDRSHSPPHVERTPHSRTSFPRLPVFTSEETPILDAGPAPPDYAAATAWRRSHPPNLSSQPSQTFVEDLGQQSQMRESMRANTTPVNSLLYRDEPLPQRWSEASMSEGLRPTTNAQMQGQQHQPLDRGGDRAPSAGGSPRLNHHDKYQQYRDDIEQARIAELSLPRAERLNNERRRQQPLRRYCMKCCKTIYKIVSWLCMAIFRLLYETLRWFITTSSRGVYQALCWCCTSWNRAMLVFVLIVVPGTALLLIFGPASASGISRLASP